MANYINQDDLLYCLHKILNEHKNDNDYMDIVAKVFTEQLIKFIEKFPTTDIEFKNGTITVTVRNKKEGAENE